MLKVATTTPHLQWLAVYLLSPEVHAAVVLAKWIEWLISSISALSIDWCIQSKGSVVKKLHGIKARETVPHLGNIRPKSSTKSRQIVYILDHAH